MDEVIRKRRETIEEHIRHKNAKNWTGVYDTFIRDETAFYDVVPFNTRFPGLGGVQALLRHSQRGIPRLLNRRLGRIRRAGLLSPRSDDIRDALVRMVRGSANLG